MKEGTRKLLLMQGFRAGKIDSEPKIDSLARWTPLSCATLGTAGLGVGSLVSVGAAVCPCALFSALGLGIGSGWFFSALALLTLTGAVTDRSIYDRIYNSVIRRLLRTPPVPRHGPPRQFGCAVGGGLYALSAIGFFQGNVWLAYIPAVFIVIFAGIAGVTQWCFASALYAFLFTRSSTPDASEASRQPS
jgi:hypothetical protein